VWEAVRWMGPLDVLEFLCGLMLEKRRHSPLAFENEALEWVRPVGKIGKQKTELCRRGFSARKLLCSAGQCVVRQYDLSRSVAQGEGKDKIVNIPCGPQRAAAL